MTDKEEGGGVVVVGLEWEGGGGIQFIYYLLGQEELISEAEE